MVDRSSDFYKLMQQAANDAINASSPLMIQEGYVRSADPLLIVVGGLELPSDFFAYPRDFAFAVGQRLAMLRKQGGEKYYIIYEV